ncbi:hypothetical protein HU200_021514 [Digitaria exilis]|uniref:Uncharacterized protein n=1 Tax=Digitaria exilis TaxID=1010633 RepID=A0A835KD90_9POAL|nr:hypothetical protein HU200_021514 [Digitaria exilis]
MKVVKVAILLFLVCEVIGPQPVAGKYPTTTGTQKRKILYYCSSYIRYSDPRPTVEKDSKCCKCVRKVPNRNMDVIVALLTDNEKRSFSRDRIRNLQELCA